MKSSYLRKILIIIILIAPFFYYSATVLYASDITFKEQRKKNNKESKRFNIPACKSKPTLFSVSPIELEDLSHIVPLGNISPPFHVFPVRHLYFNIKRINENSNSTKVANVYAPGDMWITQIESMSYLGDDNVIEQEDYRLVFSPCKEVQGYFIHLTSISNKIQRHFTGVNRSCSEAQAGDWRWISCSQSAKIKIKAGEIIGTAGGGFTNALDFGLSDFRTEDITFANPKRWVQDGVNTVCALNYYPPDLKNELSNYLGNEEQKRSIEPLCGSIAEDIPDTAQGNWFVKGTMIEETLDEDPQLALVHYNINPLEEVFSIGTSLESFGIPANAYKFTPESSGLINRDFKDITSDGNIYCYETTNQSLLIELTSSNTLKIGKHDAESCENIPIEFNSGFVEFER